MEAGKKGSGVTNKEFLCLDQEILGEMSANPEKCQRRGFYPIIGLLAKDKAFLPDDRRRRKSSGKSSTS